MKKITTVLFALCIFSLAASAQYSIFWNNREYPVTKNSLVKDSSGKSYDYTECLVALTSGEYELKPINLGTARDGFWLMGLSKEEQLNRVQQSPKPAESKDFKPGKKFTSFDATDLNGNKVNTEELKGKILVVNFWFINCFPCRLERPYLNKIVSRYKGDKDIVFIAVGLDPKEKLDEFLKESPFDYTIIPNGYELAKKYSISAYPTHVIINKEGKIVFSTVSYNAVTGYWMRKIIDELKKPE